MPRTRPATSCPRSAGWCATANRPAVPGDQAGGVRVRIDSGVIEGSEISMYYDPMIAKLVTHGAEDRTAAIDGMMAALDAFYIRGIAHNMSFLAAVVDHPRFREGRLTTNFIAEEFPEGFHGTAELGDQARADLITLAAVLQQRRRNRSRGQANRRRRRSRLGGPGRRRLLPGPPCAVPGRGLRGQRPTRPATTVLVDRWRPGSPARHGPLPDRRDGR